MVVVYFIVKSESKRSPGTDFVVGDMKVNICAIFIYIQWNLLRTDSFPMSRSVLKNFFLVGSGHFLFSTMDAGNGESTQDQLVIYSCSRNRSIHTFYFSPCFWLCRVTANVI